MVELALAMWIRSGGPCEGELYASGRTLRIRRTNTSINSSSFHCTWIFLSISEKQRKKNKVTVWQQELTCIAIGPNRKAAFSSFVDGRQAMLDATSMSDECKLKLLVFVSAFSLDALISFWAFPLL